MAIFFSAFGRSGVAVISTAISKRGGPYLFGAVNIRNWHSFAREYVVSLLSQQSDSARGKECVKEGYIV